MSNIAKENRNYENVRRILTLINILAPLHRGEQVSEIHLKLNERLGKKLARVTVYRDLYLLESMNLLTKTEQPKLVKNLNHRKRGYLYKLNTSLTQSLESAAIKLESKK